MTNSAQPKAAPEDSPGWIDSYSAYERSLIRAAYQYRIALGKAGGAGDGGHGAAPGVTAGDPMLLLIARLAGDLHRAYNIASHYAGPNLDGTPASQDGPYKQVPPYAPVQPQSGTNPRSTGNGSGNSQTGVAPNVGHPGVSRGTATNPTQTRMTTQQSPVDADDFDHPPDIQPSGAAATGATEKQIKAIYAIGRAAKRLSEGQVDDRCVEIWGVRPQELTKAEASQFINILKGDTAG